MTRPLLAIVVPSLRADAALWEHLESWAPLSSVADLVAIVVASHDGEDVPASYWIRVVRCGFERPRGWLGRDTNLRRTIGLRAALSEECADYVLMTDRKVRATPLALETVEHWIGGNPRERKAVLAGHYEDRTRRKGRWQAFLALYADHALIRKNPDFRRGTTVLTRGNAGETDSWPVTGAFFMTRAAAKVLEQAGGFPKDFRVSYEDYSTAQTLIDRGVEIVCHRDFLVEHANRHTLRDFAREYLRTGWAAAQFKAAYPHSPFGRRRARQARLTAAALACLMLCLAAAPLVALQLLLGSFAIFGLVNAWKAKRLAALLFAPIFAMCAGCYLAGFVHCLLNRGALRARGAKLYMQT